MEFNMSRQIQIRRGTATENDAFTGAIGEVTMDTTNNTLRVHDGQTRGGTVLAKKSEISNNKLNIIPDYTNGTVMNMEYTEKTFTCPSNGVIVADTTGFDNVYGYVKINGATMFNVTTNNSGYFVNGNAMFIVGAGDIVTYKSGYVHPTVHPSTNTLVFYPFRDDN